jgi:hypothetical protein
MFPWLWIFAPAIRFPWSGAVAQDFTLDAFFRGIRPGAGVPAIEQQVFEQASYGKQLGWLIDVIVDAVDPNALRSPEAKKALTSLNALRLKVERIKSDHREDRAEAAIALLDRIREDSPDELRRVLLRYAARTSIQPRTNTTDAK